LSIPKILLLIFEFCRFLNIDSWGSGVSLMKLAKKECKNIPDLSISDGFLDVFGISSSFHIAQV
jgi:hypothetical protein